MLCTDVSNPDPDGPLGEIPETEGSKSGRTRTLAMARDERLTVRQLAARAGSHAGLAFVGTPETIADGMEGWLEAEACDGFNVMFSDLPAGLDDVVDRVVPELRRRGRFRHDYAGPTLRHHLGLPRPENRFFPRVRAGPRAPSPGCAPISRDPTMLPTGTAFVSFPDHRSGS